MNIAEFVTGIQHIGVPTQDMEKTMEFYQGLGFELVHRCQKECDVCFLKLGGIFIEAYTVEKTEARLGAIDHIALNVTDVDSLFRQLNLHGYNLLDDCVNYLPFWENGVRFFNIQGPNNEKIEFNQLL